MRSFDSFSCLHGAEVVAACGQHQGRLVGMGWAVNFSALVDKRLNYLRFAFLGRELERAQGKAVATVGPLRRRDPKNELFGIYMSQVFPPDFALGSGFKRLTYEALK